MISDRRLTTRPSKSPYNTLLLIRDSSYELESECKHKGKVELASEIYPQDLLKKGFYIAHTS